MAREELLDLVVAYDWQYDQDFIALIDDAAVKLGLTCRIVSHHNLQETIDLIESGSLNARVVFDRASDTSLEFFALQKACRSHGAEIIEPLEKLRWASDKATMHLEFIANGIHTPLTIILPPFTSFQNLSLDHSELEQLGNPFIIKPANTTGGRIGVVDGAGTLQEVLQERQNFRGDKYLLQQKIIPQESEGHRFWFRGFYAFGDVQCAWWNDQSLQYRELTADLVKKYALHPLFEIVVQIAMICKLNFFSTEIAVDREGQFIVIDYVNESCDMRPQSTCIDGVPDSVVRRIAFRIAHHVKSGKMQRCEANQQG